jgi:DNA-binding response OmpR family regulator
METAMGIESTRSPRGSRSRVLIVEDDHLMRAFYKSLFQRHEDEFASRLESGGAAALLYLKDNPVDAVITDWDMPGLNGIDLIKAIRHDSTTKSLRIIMVSGRPSVEDHLQALQSGADDYLTKPIEVQILLARLRGLLRR